MAALSRSSRILFVVAVVAVAAFVFIELPRQRAEDRASVKATRLADIDPPRVDRLVIVRPGNTIDMVRDGDLWRLRSPVVDVAELSSAAQVLQELRGEVDDDDEEQQVKRDLGVVTEPERYGLAPPAATLYAMAGRDTLFRLAVGDFTVDRSAVYALRGDHVLLVATVLRRLLTMPVGAYRDHRVVTFEPAVVGSYTLTNSHGTATWMRRGTDRWFTVVAGDTVRGDSIAVPSTLEQLEGMRVHAFIPDADTARAFVDPLVVVRLHKLHDPTVTIRFVEHAPGAYWARVDSDPRTVQVEGSIMPLPNSSVETLRDRRLLQFDPARAKRLTVTTPDTSAAMVRAGDRWADPNPALGVLDAARAADFIRALRALKYTAPVPPSTPAPGARTFSLVVYGAGGTILDELDAAPLPGDPATLEVTSRSAAGRYTLPASDLNRVESLLRRIGARPQHR